MVKLSEITLEQFKGRIVAEFKPTTKNLDAIVKTIYEKRGNYLVVNALRMAKNAIDNEQRLENATTKTGILIGTKDRKGSKAPIKAALLLQRQAHIELLMWDMKVPYADGVETNLIFPATCEVAITPSNKGGMILERVLKYTKLDTTEKVIEKINLLNAISTVKGVREPNPDTYDYPLTVLVADIVDVGPVMSSAYGEEDKTYFNILEPDEKKVSTMHPALNLKLKTKEDATIWAKVSPRRYSRGYYDVSDLMQACTDAMEEFDDPKDQAKFVTGPMMNKKVIIVGSVTRKDDNPQYGMTISMDTHAIIEIPEKTETDESEFQPQQTLEKQPEPELKIIEETPTEGQTEETTDEPTEEIPGDLVTKTKDLLLFKMGVMYKARSIEGKKKMLRGLKLQDDVIDKLKVDDWVVAQATESGIEVTKEIAAAIVAQAYEELTS